MRKFWFLENPNVSHVYRVLWTANEMVSYRFDETKELPRRFRFEQLCKLTGLELEEFRQALVFACHYKWMRSSDSWYWITQLGIEKCHATGI